MNSEKKSVNKSNEVFEGWSEYCVNLFQELEITKSVEKIIEQIEEAKKKFSVYKEYFINEEQFIEAEFWIEFLMSQHITGRYNLIVYEAKEYEKKGKKDLTIIKLKEALEYFERTKIYFEEQNQNLDIELKDWIERLKHSNLMKISNRLDGVHP
jgi:hypothetical protein